MNEIPYLLQIESDVAAFHYKFPLRFDLIMARRRVMGVFKKTRPAVGISDRSRPFDFGQGG